MKRCAILIMICLLSNVTIHAQFVQTSSTLWQCTDGLKRMIGGVEQYGPQRSNRTVGLFYFIWLGAHGYDRNTGVGPDEGIMPLTDFDTLSPYNISELLKIDSLNPQWGPVHAYHHWAEPCWGYYVSNDEWVIRKQMQMIADADVDVIFLDVTNALLYMPIVTTVCSVLEDMRKKGNRTPQVAFILNTAPKQTLQRLYEGFYKKGLYEDLWFRWKGKPLVLCPFSALNDEMAAFFTVRHTWFSSTWDWFGDGKDKWTWADYYPQKAGWSEAPDKPEEVSVCVATHAHTNEGRSFHNGVQPSSNWQKSGEGAHFAEQIEQALEVDPEFVFITGWNEWIAMRFVADGPFEMTGKKIDKGDSFFVDQYNMEYSRDIEPMKGGFGDNYYYQMVDFIRRYKGVKTLPVFSQYDASFRLGKTKTDKWKKVEAVYADDKGDVIHRDHQGYGRFRRYINEYGRNDIVLTKVMSGKHSLFFYVEADQTITTPESDDWMQLYIGTDTYDCQWENFNFRTCYVPTNEKMAGKLQLQRYVGDKHWESCAIINYVVNGTYMELEIPYKELGIDTLDSFGIRFKWMDQIPYTGDIKICMESGDTAPNNRFYYCYRMRR